MAVKLTYYLYMKPTKILVPALICLFSNLFYESRAQQLPLDPEVVTGKLPNGFTYYVRKNSNQKKRVTLYLVNKTGSILETDEQRGLAHFMEHMSFNGSTHFPGATLVDFLEKAGVRFGADLNAYTSFDQTVYQLPIPTDKPEMLNSGLQVIRDWASEATLDIKEIDKERGVVLEEKRLRTGAQQRIQKQTFPLMANHSRYAERDPIGTDEVLKNFTQGTISNFYKDWYRPDLQAIIVVGDVEVKDIVKKITTLFSDLKPPQPTKPRLYYNIELKGNNQFVAITDKEVQGTTMQVMFKHPHKKLQTNADYLDYIKRNLFNQVMGLRLRSVAQKNAGSYLSASAGVTPLMANVDAFNATVSSRPGELEKAFTTFWSEISKVRLSGFTESELNSAKSQYLSSVQASLAEADKKQSAQYAQEYVRHFLQGEASPGITKEAELLEAYLPTISLGHLNQMAKLYITDTNRDVIIIAPESQKDGLPGEAKVNLWFNKQTGEDNSAVAAEKRIDRTIKMPLLADLPPKGKVVSSVEKRELSITDIKLSNGVRIILKPTAFKNDEILFNAFSPGGTSIYPDKDYYAAAQAVSLVSSGGIGDFDANMLFQKLNGKQVSVAPYIGERIEGLSGTSNVKDFETALELVYLHFTQPRKDTGVFNTIMDRAKISLSNKVSTPDKIFADTLSGVLSNYNMRRKSPGLAEIKQLDLNRSFEIYKERFGDASDFTFVIVGNIDPKKIQPLLEQYLGALPSSGRKEEAKDLHIQIPSGQITKTVYAGSEDKATVDLVISGSYVEGEQNKEKLQAIKYILGLKMIERLRELEGGVYSPSVGLTSSRVPRARYAFSISFGCSPANVEKLIAAVWDEIGKLKTNGPSADDLAKFKAEQKVSIKNALQSNQFWLTYLTSQYQEQFDPITILNFDGVLDSVTVDNLKEAVNTYLDKKNYVRAVLMPESNLPK
jgi:zinc protease